MNATPVDWNNAAEDYAAHRPPFPDVLYDHLSQWGVGLAGQVVVDLGTGLGTPGLGFARRGAAVIGVEPAQAMLAHACATAEAEGLDFTGVVATAEETGLDDRVADAVTAGQCWHWFDGPAAGREVARLLRPGGRAAICYWNWVVGEDPLVDRTFDVLRRHNPELDARRPIDLPDTREAHLADLTAAGLVEVGRLEHPHPAVFTADGWRGRLRASTWVGASLPTPTVSVVDAELRAILDGHDQFEVPHLLRVVVAGRPEAGA